MPDINRRRKRAPAPDTFLVSIMKQSNQKQGACLVAFMIISWLLINVVYMDEAFYNNEHGIQNSDVQVNTGTSKTSKSKPAKQTDFVDDDEPLLLQPPYDTDTLFDDILNHDVDDFAIYEDDEWVMDGPISQEKQNDFRKVSIRAALDDIISESTVLKDLTTPQGKAFNWILNDDKQELNGDDPNLIQRYALAVIFYSLNGENWHHGDLHWLSNVHECYWSKKYKRRSLGVVECDKKKRVTRIELAETNLQGTLPPEIGLFPHLLTLDLQNNRITGPIPPHIGNLSKLEILTMNANNLSGSIPDELGKLSQITELLIHFNELSGAVPHTICDLKKKHSLWNLWTDCASSLPPLFCNCCTVCCNGLSSCAPP